MLPLINGLMEYRESLQHGGACPPLRTYQRADGQWVAHVWPRKMIPAFFPNFTAEVWIQPGQQPTQGALYRRKAQGQQEAGGVCLVLGGCRRVCCRAQGWTHLLMWAAAACCWAHSEFCWLRAVVHACRRREPDAGGGAGHPARADC